MGNLHNAKIIVKGWFVLDGLALYGKVMTIRFRKCIVSLTWLPSYGPKIEFYEYISKGYNIVVIILWLFLL